ncbi:Uncharacterized protein APZ42_021123 [Daphnia magna]|uniref:Uncharacterized protein n=1 Tax=Daphnia magna TaxID=35525 RepID=A0A164WZG0_9CRUS|nr:Uncharacterized protein APZ42_021123 [Daphnia magna]
MRFPIVVTLNSHPPPWQPLSIIRLQASKPAKSFTRFIGICPIQSYDKNVLRARIPSAHAFTI